MRHKQVLGRKNLPEKAYSFFNSNYYFRFNKYGQADPKIHSTARNSPLKVSSRTLFRWQRLFFRADLIENNADGTWAVCSDFIAYINGEKSLTDLTDSNSSDHQSVTESVTESVSAYVKVSNTFPNGKALHQREVKVVCTTKELIMIKSELSRKLETKLESILRMAIGSYMNVFKSEWARTKAEGTNLDPNQIFESFLTNSKAESGEMASWINDLASVVDDWGPDTPISPLSSFMEMDGESAEEFENQDFRMIEHDIDGKGLLTQIRKLIKPKKVLEMLEENELQFDVPTAYLKWTHWFLKIEKRDPYTYNDKGLRTSFTQYWEIEQNQVDESTGLRERESRDLAWTHMKNLLAAMNFIGYPEPEEWNSLKYKFYALWEKGPDLIKLKKTIWVMHENTLYAEEVFGEELELIYFFYGKFEGYPPAVCRKMQSEETFSPESNWVEFKSELRHENSLLFDQIEIPV